MAQSPFLKRRVLLGILIRLFGVNFSCGIRFSLVRLEPMKQHKRPLLGPRGGVMFALESLGEMKMRN